MSIHALLIRYLFFWVNLFVIILEGLAKLILNGGFLVKI